MSARPRPTRGRRLQRGLLLLAFGTVLGVAAAELLLRAVNALLHPAMYELDDELGWRHTPSLDRTLRDETGRTIRYVTDARGLRDDPAAAPAADGAQRVLFVGDSFTDGSQVEVGELFTARIVPLLDGAVTHNAGVGGYSTVQEMLLLEQRLDELRPDLVVLMVYENDFTDNLMPYFGGLGPRPYLRVAGDTVTLVREPDPACFVPFLQPAPAAFWLYEHSAIYRSVHKNLFLPQHGQELWLREQRERDALPLADQRLAMAYLLGRIAEAAQIVGAGLLVAAIPTRDAALANDAPSHTWLAARCEAFGVPFVSLLAALHAAPADAAYFRTDIHFTRLGHDCAARALAPAIRAALSRPR